MAVGTVNMSCAI